MPATQEAFNPKGRKITFVEDEHSYIDYRGMQYISSSKFREGFFPSFNAEEVSKRKSQNTGIPAEVLRMEWTAKGEAGCTLGTWGHENLEDLMLGKPPRNVATNKQQEILLKACYRAVEALKKAYTLVSVETIIFSEDALIALTIDLIMKDEATDTIYLLDYKTNSSIPDTSWNGIETGFEPISHLPHSKFHNYALQMSLTEALMIKEGYVPRGQKFKRALIHFPHFEEKPVFIPTPDYRAECLEMIIYYMARGMNFDDIPF
jgi:hypothetical protein